MQAVVGLLHEEGVPEGPDGAVVEQRAEADVAARGRGRVGHLADPLHGLHQPGPTGGEQRDGEQDGREDPHGQTAPDSRVSSTCIAAVTSS